MQIEAYKFYKRIGRTYTAYLAPQISLGNGRFRGREIIFTNNKPPDITINENTTMRYGEGMTLVTHAEWDAARELARSMI
ncbi:MAG TPA: hypothetical protein VHP30_14050 [Ignavibacteriales bacterium]|nr:hypothetical protein [Ignavibacteriales bacterium]